LIEVRSWRCHTQRTPAGEIDRPCGAPGAPRDFLWQECRPQTVGGAEHQIPRRRGVGAGDLLDDNHRRDRVDFEAIQRLRNVPPEQPRLVHRRQDVRRQSPLALTLVAASAHERRDALRSGARPKPHGAARPNSARCRRAAFS